MKKPSSVIKRKTKIDGQILLDVKQKKKKEKVKFSESVKNLQLKLLNEEMHPHTIKSNKKINELNSNDKKDNDDNNNLLNQKKDEIKKENERKEKREKRVLRHYSMKIKMENNLAERYCFKRNDLEHLDPIKEIVIGSKKNNTDKKNKEKKKKINIIEELRKFDLKEQTKMEDYLKKKIKKQNAYNYKNNKMYKIISNENENNLNITNNGKLNMNNEDENKSKLIEEKINESEEEENVNHFFDNNKNIKKRNNDHINNFNKLFTYEQNVNSINGKDDFQKLKQKYYSNFLFTTRIPETEYKVRFLDQYLQKDSMVKNLFANYEDTKESNNNINNEKNSNKDIYYNNNSILKGYTAKNINNNYILSTNSTNNVIDSNSKYNNNNTYDQYMNSNISNLSILKSNRTNDKTVDNFYKKILNSIDNRLNKIQKNRHITNKKSDIIKRNFDNRISSDKIKTFSDISYKSGINSFRDTNFKQKILYKDFYKYYGGLFDKIDKNNGFNNISRLIN